MTAATDVVHPAGGAIAGRSAFRLFWERFREDRVALTGAIVILVLILVATFGGPIAANVTGHPNKEAYNEVMLDGFGVPQGPNAQFWFGADGAGRDLFVRTLYGARTSLIVGVVASGIAVLIGVTIGLLAGFFGGWIDTLLSRSADIMLAVPGLLIAIGIVAACGTTKEGCKILFFHLEPGIPVVVAVIAVFGWPNVARIVRGSTLSLREREFVEASRSLGAGNIRIMFREILPNLMGPILVWTTLLIPASIQFEAGLSFLGLGVPLDTASWGGLLNQAADYYDVAWWLMLYPGLFLITTTLSFNLLGDGLRDALDVRAER